MTRVLLFQPPKCISHRTNDIFIRADIYKFQFFECPRLLHDQKSTDPISSDNNNRAIHRPQVGNNNVFIIVRKYTRAISSREREKEKFFTLGRSRGDYLPPWQCVVPHRDHLQFSTIPLLFRAPPPPLSRLPIVPLVRSRSQYLSRTTVYVRIATVRARFASCRECTRPTGRDTIERCIGMYVPLSRATLT